MRTVCQQTDRCGCPRWKRSELSDAPWRSRCSQPAGLAMRSARHSCRRTIHGEDQHHSQRFPSWNPRRTPVADRKPRPIGRSAAQFQFVPAHWRNGVSPQQRDNSRIRQNPARRRARNTHQGVGMSRQGRPRLCLIHYCRGLDRDRAPGRQTPPGLVNPEGVYSRLFGSVHTAGGANDNELGRVNSVVEHSSWMFHVKRECEFLLAEACLGWHGKVSDS